MEIKLEILRDVKTGGAGRVIHKNQIIILSGPCPGCFEKKNDADLTGNLK